MSDPRRLKDDHPRRAEPLQPDKPGSGRRSDSAAPAPSDSRRREIDQQREQSDSALDNVRKGYD
jgi:hypothetical protein